MRLRTIQPTFALMPGHTPPRALEQSASEERNPLNWTGSLRAGMGETLVVLDLLLASGDLVLQKLVRVMPAFHDKQRAVEISRESQQNHLLEANFITPVVLGRRFTLSPVVIFISLIFWTWLWGVPGALLSMPMLVSIKVVCDRIPTLANVSEPLAS